MAKGGPHPLTGHLPPDRPHWGGGAYGQSGRLTLATPLGAPLPSLAIRGGPTPGGGCTPALLGGGPLSGHRAMGHWPPTGHLLAIRGGATGHRLATYPHWAPP